MLVLIVLGKVSCKSTALKRCSYTERHWNKNNTIFIVMSSAVVDLHMCISMSPSSYQSLIVPVYAEAARRSCAHAARRVAAEPTQFSGHVDLVSPVCYYD